MAETPETPTYKMTEARPANYWMSSYAIYIQLNAAGDYNYIHANCSSGSVIMCHVDGINELSYDSGHNYRRWQLTASPTVFHDNVARYVYIAIPKSAAADAMAVVVFPSEKIDIYGKNDKGEQVGSTDYYYIFTQGIISDSYSDGGSHARTWTQEIDTGTLASDEALASGGEGKWWDYNSSADTVKFLKAISEAIINKLTSAWASIKQLVLNGHLINGVSSSSTPVTSDDTLVTPKYGETKWLSKTHDDTTEHKLTMGEAEVKRVAKVFGDVIIGEQGYAGGLTGYGIKFGKDGSMEGDSLSLRRFLEVPELRYNRVEVFVGNQWRAPGAGIIESVVPDMNSDGTSANTGVITLKLEDGEIGKIDVDDICMGIYHDYVSVNNSTDDYDDAKGNFRFSGFYTCYFRITEILDAAKNSKFRYSLREYSDGTFSKHPSAFMHFVCYGNFNNKDRQSSRYSTLTYERLLRDVNTWEFQSYNIAMQTGDLSNLDTFGLDMTGYSIYADNIYMSGTIKQIENLIVRMDIENTFSEVLDYGESAPLRIFLTRGFDDFTEKAVRWKVERDSGDAVNDAAWQQKAKVVAFNGTPTIKTTEDGQRKYVAFTVAFKEDDNDLSMDNLSTLFTFTAYDKDSAKLATQSIAI